MFKLWIAKLSIAPTHMIYLRHIRTLQVDVSAMQLIYKQHLVGPSNALVP